MDGRAEEAPAKSELVVVSEGQQLMAGDAASLVGVAGSSSGMVHEAFYKPHMYGNEALFQTTTPSCVSCAVFVDKQSCSCCCVPDACAQRSLEQVAAAAPDLGCC